MTLVLETGSGIRGANSYVTAAYVTAYLTARNRQTQNSWSTSSSTVQEAACIAATAYVDFRWGPRFKSSRLATLGGEYAKATLEFAGLPSNAETITIGESTYTFVSSLSSGLTSNYEVLIGADAAATAEALNAALNAISDNAGALFSENVLGNVSCGAEVNSATDTQIDLTAAQIGLSGNDIPLDASGATNVSATGFMNGADEGVQPLEFPRHLLYDRNGIRVVGIPRNLKDACAEYAVRAVNAELFQDPTIDATGRALTRKKVGPLEWEWADGASLDLILRPYPAADRLLIEYITQVGSMRA